MSFIYELHPPAEITKLAKTVSSAVMVVFLEQEQSATPKPLVPAELEATVQVAVHSKSRAGVAP